MDNQKDIQHYTEIMCNFAEAVYQKMISKRYGIIFCCSKDLDELTLQKEKFELNLKRESDIVPTFNQGWGEFSQCEFLREEFTEGVGFNINQCN